MQPGVELILRPNWTCVRPLTHDNSLKITATRRTFYGESLPSGRLGCCPICSTWTLATAADMGFRYVSTMV